MTEKNKKTVILAVIGIFGLITAITLKQQVKPAQCPDVPKEGRADFRRWEIILPDYAHDDTLVVIDPEGLNRGIDSCDGSDGDINIVLHKYCKSVIDQPFYGIIDCSKEGYTIVDYAYRDTLFVKWGTNFDSLLYNWNN